MEAITIYLSDRHDPGTNPKQELDGLKIFGSEFCPQHKLGLLLVRPPGGDVDVNCVISALNSMYRKVMAQAQGLT
jgi:hypothetical protein